MGWNGSMGLETPKSIVQLYRCRTGAGNSLLAVRKREENVSIFRDLWSSFQSLAAENWKESRPNAELALGVTSEMYLLERVLRVGTAMVTSELR